MNTLNIIVPKWKRLKILLHESMAHQQIERPRFAEISSGFWHVGTFSYMTPLPLCHVHVIIHDEIQ